MGYFGTMLYPPLTFRGWGSQGGQQARRPPVNLANESHICGAVDVEALASAHHSQGGLAMRSVIASVVVLLICSMVALEVGGFVSVQIGKLTHAVTMSDRSVSR